VQSKNFKSQIKLYFSGSNKGWLHHHSEYHSYSMIQDDPNAANRIWEEMCFIYLALNCLNVNPQDLISEKNAKS
jgi:hypothetical protein